MCGRIVERLESPDTGKSANRMSENRKVVDRQSKDEEMDRMQNVRDSRKIASIQSNNITVDERFMQ